MVEETSKANADKLEQLKQTIITHKQEKMPECRYGMKFRKRFDSA